jgi:AcrR family transcriptional regulator
MTVSEPDQDGGRREERKAQNRAKLLIAARKVFAEKGFGEATARDIVRQTDLASGTFYNYFADKEDAFRALVEEMFERPRALAREHRQQGGATLEERVSNAYRAYFQWVAEERDMFQVFRRNASAIAVMDGGGLFDVSVAELLEDLQEWQETGDLPGLDLDYLSTAVMGAAFQVATHMVERQPPDVDGATRFCTRMFMGGIQALGNQ